MGIQPIQRRWISGECEVVLSSAATSREWEQIGMEMVKLENYQVLNFCQGLRFPPVWDYPSLPTRVKNLE